MKQGKNTPAGMATGNRVHSTGKLKMKDSKQHTFAVQWWSVVTALQCAIEGGIKRVEVVMGKSMNILK